MSEQTNVSGSNSNQLARQVALDKVNGYQAESTGLIQYNSHGRVLVIGDMRAMEMAPRLTGKLRPEVLLLDGAEEPGVPVVHLAGRSLSIEGYLGNFSIKLGEEGSPNAQALRMDLILDLSEEPLFAQAVPPPGYLHCSGEEDALVEAIDTLGDLVGSFEKPVYINYDADRCAHARSGHTACTRCIDACPAEAISSLAEIVEVDTNLCQGGGVCATVCPSGALRYSYPGPKDSLTQLRGLLKDYRDAKGGDPVLVFFAENDGELPTLNQGNLLPVLIEELASVGLEIWLSALAFGAERVLLVDRGSMPLQVRTALLEQLLVASEILQAMGYPADAIKLVDEAGLTEYAVPVMPKFTPAVFGALQDKRQAAFMAIDHLYEQAERSRPMAVLSVGAPFGTAQVDDQRCTLCMSCVGACPGKALQHGQGEPQLHFVESNCLQCGICTRTCPEDAIWITPRLLFDREARGRKVMLHEEPPFNCTACGKPFATRSVINSMLTKLQGHWMFQNERARNRLTMCEDCRVVDAMDDPESMVAGHDGQFRQ